MILATALWLTWTLLASFSSSSCLCHVDRAVRKLGNTSIVHVPVRRRDDATMTYSQNTKHILKLMMMVARISRETQSHPYLVVASLSPAVSSSSPVSASKR